LVATAVLLLPAGPAEAARVCFRYVPIDPAGNTSLKPVATGVVGQRVGYLGAVRQPYNCQPRPTHLVTFVHPFTHQQITVPLAFPEGTPRLEYRRDRVIYNYGSYTVEALFLRDGSVDVIYDSGLLRAP
jgi:hypothetical protein